MTSEMEKEWKRKLAVQKLDCAAKLLREIDEVDSSDEVFRIKLWVIKMAEVMK